MTADSPETPPREAVLKDNTGSLALDRLATVEVERAAMDLRRGLPITLVRSGTGALILSAERASRALIDRFTALSGHPGHALITRPRAETLKIRLYTDPVIAIPMGTGPAGVGIDGLKALADPAGDLDHALAGPFPAERDLPAHASGEAVRLAKIAGLLPCVIAAPIETAHPRAWAQANRLSPVDAEAVETYDLTIAETLEIGIAAALPVDLAPQSRLVAFRSPAGGPEHYALVIGDPNRAEAPLVRLHSECFTGDLLGSLKCDCGEQLRGAIAKIAADGAGVLLYLAQEGRGIGLMNKLRAYALQDQGFDTVEANERLGFDVDERAFQPAAEMLRRLNLTRIRLLTNNPAKGAALARYGIEIAGREAHAFPANPHNADYLRVKAEKTGHDFPGPDDGA